MTQQRGMALITVLLLIAMMMLLAVAGQRSWVTSLRRADTLQFSQQAKWTLQGAEQWLLSNPPATADGMHRTLVLEGETVHYRWRDKQSCFNLNALIRHGKAGKDGTFTLTSAQKVFSALLVQVGVEAERAAKATREITQQLNPDNPRDAGPVLDDITQLRAHPLMTPTRWAALSPLLCALPDHKLRINLNALTAAQTPLLAALLAGKSSPESLLELLSRRPENGWADLDRFNALLPVEQATQSASQLQSAAVFSSNEWELLMWITRDNHYAALRSRVFQHEDGRMQVRFREHGVSEE